MKTSESIELLATALALAQADMKNATLNRVNPHYRSKYADLAGIRDATAPILAKHGLTITQFTTVDGEKLSLTTRLLHKSGQWMEGEYPLPMSLDKPQAMGSALTYARRYCWSAVCGIAAEEDDDGNAAQANGNGTKANGNGKPPASDAPISAEQKQKIVDLIKETGSDSGKFCEYMGVPYVDAIPVSLFGRAVQALEKKRQPAREAAE